MGSIIRHQYVTTGQQYKLTTTIIHKIHCLYSRPQFVQSHQKDCPNLIAFYDKQDVFQFRRHWLSPAHLGYQLLCPTLSSLHAYGEINIETIHDENIIEMFTFEWEILIGLILEKVWFITLKFIINKWSKINLTWAWSCVQSFAKDCCCYKLDPKHDLLRPKDNEFKQSTLNQDKHLPMHIHGTYKCAYNILTHKYGKKYT